jgi:hypothetical protein
MGAGVCDVVGSGGADFGRAGVSVGNGVDAGEGTSLEAGILIVTSTALADCSL